MRDIQMVLERWGAWAASGNAGVDYSPLNLARPAAMMTALSSKTALRA